MMNNAINIMLDVDDNNPVIEEWKEDLSFIEQKLSKQEQGEKCNS